MPKFSYSLPSEMLNTQMDFLIKDYFSLLAVAGAAARLIQDWDIADLPAHLVRRAELLSLTLNYLPDNLFQEALEAGYSAGFKRAQIRESVYHQHRHFLFELSKKSSDPKAAMNKIKKDKKSNQS